MRKFALLFLLVPFVVSACHHGMISQVRGSGKRVSEKRQIPAFTSIETNGAFTITIEAASNRTRRIDERAMLTPSTSEAALKGCATST